MIALVSGDSGGNCAMKLPFDIDKAMQDIERATADFPKAALFELAEQGYDSAFEQLIACVISIRTRDEVTLPTSRRLFERARTPAEVADMTPTEIDEIIGTSSFHEAKSRQIHEIARQLVADHNGTLPCDGALMQSFSGVGPKCAHLTLGIACGQARVSADVHVHRVTNRWGYVETTSPERTIDALEEKLPRKYWVEINRLLVPFGKHICTGRRPKCSTCPVLEMCQQVGVTEHR